MKIGLGTLIQQNPRTSYRTYDDETVIIYHDKKEMIRLNPVASLAWNLVENPIPFREVVDSVLATFDVDRVTASNDLDELFNTFMNYGLVCLDGSYANTILSEQQVKGSLAIEQTVNVKTIGKTLRIPIHAILEITENCNQACVHCYNEPDIVRNELSTDSICVLLDELKSLGCLELTITGGDPFMRKDFWEIISYARKLKFSILLKSNGTLIDETIAKKLYSHCVTEVHVSIYSMDDKKHDAITGLKGSMKQTLCAIDRLMENGITVRVSCPVTQGTLDDVYPVKQYVDSIGSICGFDLIITKKVNGDIRPVNLRLTDDDIGKIFEDKTLCGSIFSTDDVSSIRPDTLDIAFDPDDSICGAGVYLISVNAYGDVFPCIAWQQHAGNILDNGMTNIWHQSKVLNNLRKLKNKDLGECLTCNAITNCPRCPGVLYHETGDISSKMDIMCLIAKNLNEKTTKI